MILDGTKTSRQIRLGLSLIEVVVSTVIVAFIISASLQTVATAVSTRTRTTELQLGPSLARDLLSELLQKPYSDPDTASSGIGLDSGESSSNRLAFDDLDDFHGWSSNSPVAADGSALPIGAGWQRQVSVVFLDPADMSTTGTDLGLKSITVTVVAPSGDSTVVQTLRSRMGANERPTHADRDIVTGASTNISLTSGVTAEVSRTLSKNHPLDE